MRRPTRAFGLCLSLLIAGCGGGGGAQDSPPPAGSETATAERLFTAGELLAAQDKLALHRTIVVGGPDLVTLRRLDTQATQTLDAVGSNGGSHWQLGAGRAFAAWRAADCASQCIYQWADDGRRSNLSDANPLYQGATQGLADFDEAPVVRGHHLLWTAWRQFGGYVLYDATTAAYRHIPQPPQTLYTANWGYDLAPIGSAVHVVFWAPTAGSGDSAELDIFHWQSEAGDAVRLTQGGARNMGAQTDGLRAAWQRWASGARTEGSFTLMAQDLSGGAATALTTTATRFLLRDGVLAWNEGPQNSQALRVSTGDTSGLIGQPGARLLANAQGHVIYLGGGQAGNGLYDWNARTGESRLLVADAPSFIRVFVAGEDLIYQIVQDVFRVPLAN